MKIYIAASSRPEERPRVDEAFSRAGRMGIEVVGDWRPDIDKNGPNLRAEMDVAPFARKDLAAIDEAHATWMLGRAGVRAQAVRHADADLRVGEVRRDDLHVARALLAEIVALSRRI